MCVGQLCQSDSGRTIEDFGQSESGQSGTWIIFFESSIAQASLYFRLACVLIFLSRP